MRTSCLHNDIPRDRRRLCFYPNRHPILFTPKSNYELFNYSNFSIRYWSWNYRGCWHQTCPPIVPRESDLNCAHSNCSPYISRVLHCYFLSLPPCVRIGQFARLLPSLEVGAVSPGSLSGIEPQFSVTRHHHGWPRSNHRKLMGQKFEWSIASQISPESEGHAIRAVIMNRQLIWYLPCGRVPVLRLYLINADLPLLRKVDPLFFCSCISSWITTVIHAAIWGLWPTGEPISQTPQKRTIK